MALHIEIQKTQNPRQRVAEEKLGFGKFFSDHMFTLEYADGQWQNAQIRPYSNFSMEPGASVFHYGQALFEGMKAFRRHDGGVNLFRPEYNARRMRDGAERLCMAAPAEEDFIQAVTELVKIDESWIPNQKDSALYLRPTLIGTESFLGVRPSEKYLFFIICSPVGAYYAEKFSPVKIWIESQHIRAAAGGLGATKAAANYAASLKASHEAKKRGYSQVLWLDAQKRKYVEEVGTMNVFFRIGNEIITPSLDGTILAGGTRDCVIQLLKDWDYKVTERKISIDELQEAHQNGILHESFGTGTAAVITPVGILANESLTLEINQNKVGEVTQKLHTRLSGIQVGLFPDPHGWTRRIL